MNPARKMADYVKIALFISNSRKSLQIDQSGFFAGSLFTEAGLACKSRRMSMMTATKATAMPTCITRGGPVVLA
jgi:hypothetical protein